MPSSLLPANWDIPQVFRRRVGSQPGRQRAMQADGHLLLLLHHPPEAEQVQRRPVFFWRSPEGAWLSNDYGGGPAALEQHLKAYSDLIAKFDRQEDQAATASEYFELLGDLAPVLRASRNMHKTLQEARTTCPDDSDLINVRDRAYEIERTADLLYNDAKNALDYCIARRAEEQARHSFRMAVEAHRLNLLAAFFLPIATLTAVFGVNLAHGYETAHPPWVFLGVLTVGLMLGLALMAVIRSGRQSS